MDSCPLKDPFWRFWARAVLGQRVAAKRSREFDAADKLRDELRGLGVEVDDKARTWRLRGGKREHGGGAYERGRGRRDPVCCPAPLHHTDSTHAHTPFPCHLSTLSPEPTLRSGGGGGGGLRGGRGRVQQRRQLPGAVRAAGEPPRARPRVLTAVCP
jgi:hypothetical protein